MQIFEKEQEYFIPCIVALLLHDSDLFPNRNDLSIIDEMEEVVVILPLELSLNTVSCVEEGEFVRQTITLVSRSYCSSKLK